MWTRQGFLRDNAWLETTIEHPSCLRIVPSLTTNASNSIVNSLEKLGKVRIDVYIIAYFMKLNVISTSIVHWNWSFCKSIMRWTYFFVILNKFSIVTCESKKSLLALQCYGCRPSKHNDNYYWIYGDLVLRNQMP